MTLCCVLNTAWFFLLLAILGGTLDALYAGRTFALTRCGLPALTFCISGVTFCCFYGLIVVY